MLKRTAWRIVIIITILICLFASRVIAEHVAWDCPDCGRTGNTGNYCGGCAHSAPWIESSTDPFQTAPPSSQESIPDNASLLHDAIGEIIQFGNYEQDGNASNGPEPIEWYVLDCDDQGILLISRYSLDSKPFNKTDSAMNWETCSLRLWLNNEFYNEAFSAQEKAHIIDSHVSPAQDRSSETEKILDQGNETTDRVYLLSRDEWLEKYRSVLWDQQYDSRIFISGMIPMSAPKTIHAVQNAGGDERDKWWLRGEVHDKTNDYPYSALAVCDGYCPVTSPLTEATYGVRPLVHIDSIDGLNE